MILSINDDLKYDFQIEKQPTKTYKLNITDMKISGVVDGAAAIEQTIYKILGTERYDHMIYSWNYGVELSSLFGEPLSYVYPEVKRRIKEALVKDERITNVDDFVFTRMKGKVLVKFTVSTTEGNISIEKMVSV